ncbi:hypothetical protein LTR53_011785 [Teratosphaeriaceae sp. CCFEE 6253]|nr:hypothetical protein LTR53_011785 [Teratosphaeriaceae sp. CCFEE 6253]
MPTKLKIKPPRLPTDQHSSSSPSQQSTASPPAGAFTFSASPLIPVLPRPCTATTDSLAAPEYSPITPKVQPILPATTHYDACPIEPPETHAQSMPSAIAPAECIPQPAPLPFSSEDSTDAIALRAAISSLQYQRKKAQDDLRKLEEIKRDALEHPQHFRDELVAGRLREQRPSFGGVQAILDAEESDDDSDDSEDEALPRANDVEMPDAHPDLAPEIPDSQPSRPGTSSAAPKPSPLQPLPDFTSIPGPQTVVRMPAVKWEKYHVVGDALDHLHEQQRRWPGSTFAYGRERGREHSVAAPFSPFQDGMLVGGGAGEDGEGGRKDSGATGGLGGASATGTVSEHPMETRRGSQRPQP